MPTIIREGKCSCGHLVTEHRISTDRSCGQCQCPQYVYSELLAGGHASRENWLRNVLERNYKGNCTNCNRAVNLSDIEQNYIDGRSLHRLVCQDCGEQLLGVWTEGTIGIGDFIRILDKKPNVTEGTKGIGDSIRVLDKQPQVATVERKPPNKSPAEVAREEAFIKEHSCLSAHDLGIFILRCLKVMTGERRRARKPISKDRGTYSGLIEILRGKIFKRKGKRPDKELVNIYTFACKKFNDVCDINKSWRVGRS